ncbi:IclR family transcriptional regulator [Alterinioella nitratireducens]|jgi:IclR family acetate operon transcriptional repressor|uniref:IclR family transcriptional regulator n=1 Tax=Alterinioella nitratireducens TaxID=2735915 RepID=UPI00405947A6
MSKPRKTAPTPTRALDRGLHVLEVVANRPGQTLAEISTACDLSPATALRILETLRGRDFLIRNDETKTYGIGLRALEVGSRFLADTGLRETAQGSLAALATETGLTATLAVLQDGDVVYLDVFEGTGSLRSAARIGGRAPIHATAAGKILLAWHWSAGLDDALGRIDFAALTPNTITDADRFRAELEQVRTAGLAFDRQERDVDICCISAPIRKRTGEVIGALGLQGPARSVADREDHLCTVLAAAAVHVSSRLGYRGPRRDPGGDDTASTLID